MVKGVGKGREKRAGRLTDDDDQGGANGGICHGGDDGMNGLVDQTQSTVGTTAHGGVDDWRSHGVKVSADIRVTTDRDGDNVRGSQGADGERMGLSDTTNSGDQGEGVGMSARGGARVPED